MVSAETLPLTSPPTANSESTFDCSQLIGWRTTEEHRNAWRAWCNLVFGAELLGICAITTSSTLRVMLATLFVKMTIETWGQRTPTWVAPNTIVVFLMMYAVIVPSMCWMVLKCDTPEFTFAGRSEVALALYFIGTIYSLTYELHRFRFKALPENKGKLHTGQLASLSIHPNYCGDLITFSGFALGIGNSCALSLPTAMVWTFDYIVIPNSDKYLAKRYGAEFEAYSARTQVLIPFLPRPFLHVLSWLGLAMSVYYGMFCGDACRS